jgi:hypothetical protein
MACYIFLKSLRSLEEFRKNPHVKIPPKSPFTNFQILGKFKNLILIRKILFFPDFRPGRPCGPLGLWPSQPTGRAIPTGQNRPACPSSPRVGRVFAGNTFSFSVHTFPSRPPLPRLSVNRAPSVRCVFPTTLADPDRFLPSPPATPRHPTSDLMMPGKTITPHLDSPP